VIRIGIFDSSPIVLYGLKQLLISEGMGVVGTAVTPHEPATWPADVLLVDPDALPAPKAYHYLANWVKHSAVLVLAATPHTERHARYLEVGAQRVISKCEPPAIIVNAVRAAYTADTDGQTPAADRMALSEREEQVLWHISLGLTHGQIARRLGISQHTVDTYVKRIRAKLQLGNKAELTRAAMRSRLPVAG